MGKIIRCPECSEVYRRLERLEDLRDNDGACMVCNAPIEVQDWDRILASHEDDDLDDVDDLDEVEDDVHGVDTPDDEVDWDEAEEFGDHGDDPEGDEEDDEAENEDKDKA